MIKNLIELAQMYKPSRLALFQDSSSACRNQSRGILLILFGLSFMIIGSYAIFMGGAVIAEVTPYGIRLEVIGRPK